MTVPKINSAHGSDTRNIINRAIEVLNAQGKSIQDLVAEGQLTPEEYGRLLKVINNTAEKSEVDKELDRILSMIDSIITTPADGINQEEIVAARDGKGSLGANINSVRNQIEQHISKELNQDHILKELPNGIADERIINYNGDFEIIKRVSNDYAVDEFFRHENGVKYDSENEEYVVAQFDFRDFSNFVTEAYSGFVGIGGILQDDVIGKYENMDKASLSELTSFGQFSASGGSERFVIVTIPAVNFSGYPKNSSGLFQYFLDKNLRITYPLSEPETVTYPNRNEATANTRVIIDLIEDIENMDGGLTDEHQVRSFPNGYTDKIIKNSSEEYQILREMSEAYKIDDFINHQNGVKYSSEKDDFIILQLDISNYTDHIESAHTGFVSAGGILFDKNKDLYDNKQLTLASDFNAPYQYSSNGGSERWLVITVPKTEFETKYNKDDAGVYQYLIDNDFRLSYPLKDPEVTPLPLKNETTVNTSTIVKMMYDLQELKNRVDSGDFDSGGASVLQTTVVDEFDATLINLNQTLETHKTHSRVSELSKDGRIYISGSYYIQYSDDYGETWTLINGHEKFPTIRRILACDDGEVLLMSTNGQIWRSSNDLQNWTQVLESVGGTGFNEANFNKYGDIVLAGNYGGGLESLQIWMSGDEGHTWRRIMNENPDVNWNHMHDVKFDPYENLIWGCNGDDYNDYSSEVNRIWMSPDYGETWSYFKGFRATQIIPLPHCVLFLSDEHGRASILRYDRKINGTNTIRFNAPNIDDLKQHYTHPEDWEMSEAYFVHTYEDELGVANSWGSNAAITYGNDAMALFGFTGNPVNPHPLTVMATTDGYHFNAVWRTAENIPSPYGVGGVYGPDNSGNYVAAVEIKGSSGEWENHLLKLSPRK